MNQTNNLTITPPWRDASELRAWLEAHHIRTDLWGKGKAKSVQLLWQEIQTGESQLLENPVQRGVRVVTLVIHNHDRVLVEAAQLFTDGRLRRRRLLPSEKLQMGETYLDAAKRCLSEELDVPLERCILHEDTHRTSYRTTDSFSYPQLTTRYELHQVAVTVPGLPDHAFHTQNHSCSLTDPIRIHYWEWQDAHEVVAADELPADKS